MALGRYIFTPKKALKMAESNKSFEGMYFSEKIHAVLSSHVLHKNAEIMQVHKCSLVALRGSSVEQ